MNKTDLFGLLFLLSIMFGMAVVQRVDQKTVSAAPISLSIPPAEIMPVFTEDEVECVRRVVYGEARGESYQVQLAVAATVVNRSLSGKWPTDLCGVVKQPKQFVGYRTVITLYNSADVEAWDDALEAAHVATSYYGTLSDDYRRMIFFHSTSLKTDWQSRHTLIQKIGGLVFYAQT